MEHLDTNPTQRIHLFVEKKYFSELHRFYHNEDISPKLIERHLEGYLKRFLGFRSKTNYTDYIIDKHLISTRQVITASDIAPNEVQGLLREQVLENLFIERHYSLTTKVVDNKDQALNQAVLQNTFSLKVLDTLANNDIDIICLFIRDNAYIDLLQYLKKYPVKVLLFAPRSIDESLAIDDNLYEHANGLITSLNFQMKPEEGTAEATEKVLEEETTQKTPIFHHKDEDPEESKLGELLGKIKSAPKIEVVAPKPRIVESKTTTHTIEQKEEEEKDIEEIDDFNEGEEYIGEIANIVKTKGFAFIKRSPANVFLYYGNMVELDDFYELEVGTKVIYKMRYAKGGRVQAYDVYLLEE